MIVVIPLGVLFHLHLSFYLLMLNKYFVAEEMLGPKKILGPT